MRAPARRGWRGRCAASAPAGGSLPRVAVAAGGAGGAGARAASVADGQAARRAAARSAPPRRAGEAVPLAAAARPGSHAQGHQAAPLRRALAPLPALASRGPLARWCGSVAGTAQAGQRRLLVPGAGGVVCGRYPLSEGRSAPSGPLWLRRSGPRKACGPQLCRHLPQGSVKVWGQLEDSLAPRGSQRRYRLHVSAA